jgi:hypothetical protein
MRAVKRPATGKADNLISQVPQNADIGWTASRGPIVAPGAQDVLPMTDRRADLGRTIR